MDESMAADKVEVFVCMNVDCRSRGSEAMLRSLDACLAERGMDHVVTQAIMCFAACNIGPNVVIPSIRCWLSDVSKDSADAVIDVLNGAEPASRFQIKNDPEIGQMIFEMIDAGLLEKAPSR